MFTTLQVRAWKVLMISGINEAFTRGLATPDALDDPEELRASLAGVVFNFTVSSRWPAIGSVRLRYPQESLAVHVALNPGKEAERWITAPNADGRAGDAFATGYLERGTCAFLRAQAGMHLCCRPALLEPLTKVRVTPNGYLDRDPRPEECVAYSPGVRPGRMN